MVRQRLDDAGLTDVKVLVSGDIDEYRIETILGAGAPVDGFGVGGNLGVGLGTIDSGTVGGVIGAVYKLVWFDSDPDQPGRIKLAGGKSTWPGRKQVYRMNGFERDIIQLDGEPAPEGGRALLEPIVVWERNPGEFFLVGGFHRHAAIRRIRSRNPGYFDRVDVRVIQGLPSRRPRRLIGRQEGRGGKDLGGLGQDEAGAIGRGKNTAFPIHAMEGVPAGDTQHRRALFLRRGHGRIDLLPVLCLTFLELRNAALAAEPHLAAVVGLYDRFAARAEFLSGYGTRRQRVDIALRRLGALFGGTGCPGQPGNGCQARYHQHRAHSFHRVIPPRLRRFA